MYFVTPQDRSAAKNPKTETFLKPVWLKTAVRVLFRGCPDKKLIFMIMIMILQFFSCISCIHSPFAKAKEILSLYPIQKPPLAYQQTCERSLPNLALRKELRETQLQLPEKRQAGATGPNDTSSCGFSRCNLQCS